MQNRALGQDRIGEMGARAAFSQNLLQNRRARGAIDVQLDPRVRLFERGLERFVIAGGQRSIKDHPAFFFGLGLKRALRGTMRDQAGPTYQTDDGSDV